MWVKICGNTSLEDARGAAEAGADALGFVFAPSKRQVTVEQVAVITPHLPEQVEKIGVFVDASFEEIAHAVEVAGLTGVQLHSAVHSGLATRLRARFGPDFRLLQVIHYQQELTSQLTAVRQNTAIDGVLIDSRTATLVGGTGVRFDWPAARRALAASAEGLKIVVAGGLDPINVAEAIATLQPWGVDVVTGVEAAPGRKDHAKVKAFLENARIAASKLNTPISV
ncbi:phosphoribosylanthranilate isomerase [Silvibacterium dinghuense]|uniref:N-(5'-phosphoribosyl)anthranilate isomerase n=1 Tax=Silvibacterium dinghuense TaxID=1560006 RepID=A0A4Q1SJE6_9BACT|nr:phosphoribosylanthranilate isomerase [Silvibacterium dinghuense]RXS97555.1 phosphoribosylanthranilate isomerase [Silvibacterium dinghuense]GGG99987.1 N-(5'-phosphoribosyl)anthranilate isomerase [Silvibacterium dinghuense]